jgi:hypothetical protein
MSDITVFTERTACGQEGETGVTCDCEICYGVLAINNHVNRVDIVAWLINVEGNWTKEEKLRLVTLLTSEKRDKTIPAPSDNKGNIKYLHIY